MYRCQFPDFPQQSTVDQFFSESQFESYRRLGLHCVETALDFDTPHLDELFERAMNRWRTSPVAPSDASRHADAYTKFLDAWSKASNTANFDSMVVVDGPANFADGDARILYFLILDLLQLMEGVVVDCGLDRTEQQRHPANAGGCAFSAIGCGGMQSEVWKSQRANYRPQFRFFVDDLSAEYERARTPKE